MTLVMSNVLQEVANIITISSGSQYATISTQSLKHELIFDHYETSNPIIHRSATVKSALTASAHYVLLKIESFKFQLCNNMNKITIVLDLWIGTEDESRALWKFQIRSLLRQSYPPRKSEPSGSSNAENKQIFNLFQSTVMWRKAWSVVLGSWSHSIVQSTVENSDEIDDYYIFTMQPENSCKYVLSWWKSVGKQRLPRLSKRAKDTLTVMRSSLSSKCALAHSGQYVTADTAKRSDEIFCKQMKLSCCIDIAEK